MKYKHIIWDYNGTLLNDAQLCVDTLNGMLAERNLPPVTYQSYRKEFGFPVKKYYEHVGFNFEKEDFNLISEDFISRYNRKLKTAKLHDGAAELIQELHEKGIRQSVLSARKEIELITELTDLKLIKYFDYISGLSDNLAYGKLDNGIAMRKKIKLADREIALIGDTVHDCETAQAMKTDFLGLSHGHHPPEKLQICGKHIFPDIPSLKKFLFQK